MFLNMAVPILIGAAIYLIMSPDVYFGRIIASISGFENHTGSYINTSFVLKVIRYYLPDMLWGYSLIFALSLAYGRGRSQLISVFVLAVSFSAMMECFQLFPVIPGSFDFIDIAVEAAAELLAVFIIKNMRWEERKNES